MQLLIVLYEAQLASFVMQADPSLLAVQIVLNNLQVASVKAVLPFNACVTALQFAEVIAKQPLL